MDNFNTRSLIVFGCVFIALTVGGFLFWAMTAKLSAATIAPGTLVVESQRKKVQHLQGGWVKAIHVREGQHVQVGDVLLELANSKAESDFHRLRLKAMALQAQRLRIQAELEGASTVNWTAFQAAYDAPDVQLERNNILNAQQLQFQQAVMRLSLQENQYQQRKLVLDEQLRGVGFQLKAVTRQLSLVNQEIRMTAKLLDKGFVSKTRMLELQRHQAGVDVQLAELKAEKEVLAGQLQALEQEYAATLFDIEKQLAAELTGLDAQWRDVNQSLKAAKDVRERVTIRSEHTGTVVGLNVHTVGGVVNAGDVIMEIVPDSDDLIVEALVSPEDIDVVHNGLQAKVRLSAYNIRRTPPVKGEVIHVAADRVGGNLANAKGEQQPSGYWVKVRLDQQEIASLDAIKLYPGMPTEVFILLEQQTLWEYFTAPLFNSYYRAFRET
ncbi:HlyD family type I secretion periplasmic adaptor subunit [Photobacterium aphoticum]|uniref:Membrane fusion protein (MFP) family protein n=1 Tax=Photobacterium aphoticum TaxID=754436 RepID=A0A0J1GTX6_9GAMM|nr:HlyD family type I secretion periplasmic adaptor subunit [Photobacterium aphoticum]KLV03121.1 secretion protein HlyD [Photobacterium aphoticum]PSU56531.1 HlyD family type I secretion periplasmic adaptor subunit [Photobacterium aphoticum]GHA51982.1 HlyD family type I secretion periplasmic adaptor subunit [Photobacterium aphoticum]